MEMSKEKYDDTKTIVKDMLEHGLNHAKKLFRWYENGIEGVSRKIKNPELETLEDYFNGEYNGSVKKYLDFPAFYQLPPVALLLEQKRILIDDEMSIGKTAEATIGVIAIENDTGKKVKALVVTPNTVKSHWDDEIIKYVTKERQKNVVTIDSYDKNSLSKIKDADIVILNYEIFGNNTHREKLTERLLKERFNYVILDEVHNAKNFNTHRARNIKKIADKAEYLALLSGTPLPDYLKDAYMLIALLEKDVYKDKRDEKGNITESAVDVVRKAYWDKPDLIKVILKKRRVPKRKLEEILDLPRLLSAPKSSKGVIKLNSEQRALYDNILKNDNLEGSYKLQQLRAALLDPLLVDKKIITDERIKENIEKIPSTKYLALDKIIKKKAARGEKIIVYSPIFVNGVLEKLEEKYAEYGALRLDGNIDSINERKRIKREFQKNPEKKVIFISDVAAEGISLTAGTNLVILDEPYSPGARKQIIARPYRRGQKRNVRVISLAVKDSIDEGILKFLRQKEEAINFVIETGGSRPPREYLEVLTKEPEKTRAIKERLYTANQLKEKRRKEHTSEIARRYSLQMVGKGYRIIHEAMDRNNSKIGRDYAKAYTDIWKEDIFQANIARFYTNVIKEISKKENLENKVDIGSAFGVLSHSIGEPVTNIELNRYFFEQKLAKKESKNISAPMHELPLKDKSFDLAVCSLSLNDTRLGEMVNFNGKNINEREKAIREAHRILRERGYYIVTLPASVINRTQEKKFREGFENIGFDIVPELTGYVTGKNLNENTKKKRKKECKIKQGLEFYILVARKNSHQSENNLKQNQFFLNVDDMTAGQHKVHAKNSVRFKRGIYDEFYLNGRRV